MKTWTMPRIDVEAFAANEHVAACSDAPSFDFKGHFALDLFFGSGYSGHYVHDGNADGIFQASYESISDGQFSTASPEPGLYTNKTVYAISHGPSTGFRYNESYYFTPKGTASVWVTSTGIHVWGYDHEIDPTQYNPETGKNWS